MRKKQVVNMLLAAIAMLGMATCGCTMIDEAAEGWMVIRHYQKLRERDRERRKDYDNAQASPRLQAKPGRKVAPIEKPRGSTSRHRTMESVQQTIPGGTPPML